MHKILIVEDEESIVRVLSRSLKADGYDVVTAYNGEQGLKVFNKESPGIVLTDIKMPGMDGIELLKKIKEISPETEVIIITGHGDMESSIEALQFDASDFINKPITENALSIALRRAEEKIDIKRQLKEYTTNLEKKVQEATKELRRKSYFQSKLIKSSNDAIVATDESLNVVIFNPEAEKIFGYSSSEVENRKNIFDIFPQELAETFKEKISKNKHFKDISWQETQIYSKTGEKIPVRFSGTILYEQNTAMGAVTFFQDLREIKRLEKELIQSERLAAIGQTIAGLAHGIKNILYGFKGGSYLVDVGIEQNDMDKLKNGWGMVKRNIDRISSLVMDLLFYSKEREPEFQTCAPNDIAKEVCELFSEMAKENNVEIIKEFDPSIGEVAMDPQTIHRCLSNLVSNALDACAFDEDETKKWRVIVRTGLENSNVRFEVEDNGIGMSEEIQDKLFSSFFSTKGGKGTGLGLLVTRKLIEEHQGTIEVKSQQGKGSAFIVRLPIAEGSYEQQSEY